MNLKKLTLRILACAAVLPAAVAEDDSTVSRHDQLKIAAQKICPVMGKSLGSMGPPIKVRIGQQELFLCCEACRSKRVDREHWATIHANFRHAQGQCPVMGKPLPAKAQYTIVSGQLIYTCCPPCIKKIEADPQKWLQKVDELYAASLTAGRSPDQIKIAVQKICPVMGKPLGSMGPPVAVKVGGEKLFLCCEACRTKQIDRKHWNTIHNNFAKAQGICPIMKKPLPVGAGWTVVGGNLIYVCCPPCVEKIQAKPDEYSQQLMELYAKHVGHVASGTDGQRAPVRN